jgi:predicted ArsR family transcriptional regulator
MQTTIPVGQILADPKKARHTCPYRAGTKKARLHQLLRPAKGITSPQLAKLLGWLPHTARSALAGLRKDGVAIDTLPPPTGEHHVRYRLSREV